jgi:aspartate racemase
MNDKIIGIIGGMGPEATADFYSKIIKATKVTKDQEHFRVIIDSNPKIPDRTLAIIGKGESPIKEMIETAKNLELAKVEVACIPCITAHYFIDEIQSQVNFKILNALEVLNDYIKKNYKDAKKIGVLSTTGTMKAGMFHKYLPEYEIIYPNAQEQEDKVMEAIYGKNGIKCGNYGDEPISLLIEAANGLISSGADVIVSGCTEISIVLKPNHLSKPLIDTMEVLAQKLVLDI